MIELLGMSPSNFGHSFIFFFLSVSIIFGGFLSKKLQTSHGSKKIMDYGIVTVLISSFLFVLLAFFKYSLSYICNTFTNDYKELELV